MSIKPIRDQVVVKRFEEAEMSRGGIIIAPTSREKPSEGTVVAVGSGKILPDGTSAPLEVKVGDKVMFRKHTGVDIKVDDEDFIVLTEDSILCVIG